MFFAVAFYQFTTVSSKDSQFQKREEAGDELRHAAHTGIVWVDTNISVIWRRI